MCRPENLARASVGWWDEGLNFQDFSLFRFLFIGKEMKNVIRVKPDDPEITLASG